MTSERTREQADGRTALVVGLLLCAAPASAYPQTPGWTSAAADYDWSFPRDHWAHPSYKTEWWYFTGHLDGADDPGRRFAYQFTFFRVGISPDTLDLSSAWATSSLIMGHAAVTDLATGNHVFSELLYRPTPFLGHFARPADTLVAWSRAPAGTDGVWTLAWNGGGFDFAARDDVRGLGFALSTRATKPRVFQGPGGYSRKGRGATAASLYYSYTRLATSGTVTVGTDTLRVRGESWMDKEFGSNQLDANQAGWDWFSLQLSNGRELMFYQLRDTTGARDFALGTVVDRDGAATYLEGSEWRLRVTATWQSPQTGATYPAAWSLDVPGWGLEMAIEPLVADQENVSALIPNLHYWEGAVVVRDPDGNTIGRGFVELTGYGTMSRPAI